MHFRYPLVIFKCHASTQTSKHIMISLLLCVHIRNCSGLHTLIRNTYVLCVLYVLYVLYELYVLYVLYVLYELYVLYVLHVLYELYVLYVCTVCTVCIVCTVPTVRGIIKLPSTGVRTAIRQTVRTRTYARA